MTEGQEDRFLVTFWGTRGSISTPGTKTEKYGGNTPCVSVTRGSTRIVLDAGTGIRNLGLELADARKEGDDPLRIHLLLSHTHWDHIQGLPFFEPAYMGDASLAIYGSPRKERFLEGVLRGQMDVEYFPVEMNALAADLSITELSGNTLEIDGIKVEWQEQTEHPGGSVRYRLSAGGHSIVYSTDIELDRIFPDGPGNPGAPAEAAAYREFVRGTDLLIADGQYTAEEYTRRRGWGHTSIPVLVDVVKQCSVGRLAVFHHEPRHSDAMLDEVWSEFAARMVQADGTIGIFWAREGMTIAI